MSTDMKSKLEKWKADNIKSYKDDSCWNEAENFEYVYNRMAPLLLKAIEQRDWSTRCAYSSGEEAVSKIETLNGELAKLLEGEK